MAETQPTISVIITTFKRPAQLLRCLNALASQDYPRERFEVVVLVDGGATPPESLVNRVGERMDLRLVKRPHRGISVARNEAVSLAGGELLAFTDDDAEPLPGWLAALASANAARPADGVGGRTVPMLPDNAYSRVSDLILRLAHAYHHGDEAGGARFFATSNLALPAGPYREIGGFDPRLRNAEDRELCDRWLERGHRLTFCPDAIVRHDNPTTLARFCRKQFGYGRGAFAYQRARARRGLGLSGFDSSFYRHQVLGAARSAISARDLSGLALLAAWQVLNAAGFAWEAVAQVARRTDVALPG
jgi:glycosyltransferase involved in cell wall biosynthesis